MLHIPFHTKFLLHLADSALLLGHRNSEWTGHGPILEQDIALSNIALDLIGQSRNLYQYAALQLNEAYPGSTETEDSLAYLRDTREFYNLLIVELPKGDWAFTTLRQFFFSAWQKLLFTKLLSSQDLQLAAISEKSVKETNYHLRWSGEWVIRLGDGTVESRRRLIKALEFLWPYTGEFFKDFEGSELLIHYCELADPWNEMVTNVFEEAGLAGELQSLRTNNNWMHSGGADGLHTEHLGFLLAEMQFLQRAYPGCSW